MVKNYCFNLTTHRGLRTALTAFDRNCIFELFYDRLFHRSTPRDFAAMVIRISSAIVGLSRYRIQMQMVLQMVLLMIHLISNC